MQIGKIFKKINKKFKFHKFSELKFDSLKCKRGDVFFAIKGTKKMETNLLKMPLIMEQRQLFQI